MFYNLSPTKKCEQTN